MQGSKVTVAGEEGRVRVHHVPDRAPAEPILHGQVEIGLDALFGARAQQQPVGRRPAVVSSAVRPCAAQAVADEEESEAGDAADAGAADGAFGWSELHSEVPSMPLGPSAHGECHGHGQYGEMGTNKEVWLVVADTDGARLLHGTPTQFDHLHIEEVAKLATQFREGEHKRPTRLSVPSRSVASSKELDLATAEFASELAPWVEKELRARSIANCALFAPSHLIGAMRKAVGKNMTGLLTEYVGEFAQLTNGELGKHPRIVELLLA